MGLSITDRRAYEAHAAPESLGGRQNTSSKEAIYCRTARRWNHAYAVVDRVERVLITTSWRSCERMSAGWARILDRDCAPRRWWWPAAAEVPLNPSDLQRQHAQCSETTNRLLFTLLGFCFFCLLTLGGSDAALLGSSGQVAVPVVNLSLSNVAFLKVGPFVLIALLLYVHILRERLLRYDALDDDQRLPHIFNMRDPVSRLLSWFLFYWMVPMLLALFAWKAGPLPEAPLIGSVAIIVTMLLIWLQMRRCPEAWRRCNIALGVALIALLALVPFIATGQIGRNRQLNLFEAVLEKRDLSGFHLRAANLSRANLKGAFLSQANLRAATLKGANLTGAILSGAVLSQADLSYAEGLHEADLRDMDFEAANLTDTDLRKADLSGAILYRTSLDRTKLQGTNLEGAVGLTREQIDSAITDATTRLPSSLLRLSEKR
jgi:Pentapeptide repeats (8 copies)